MTNDAVSPIPVRRSPLEQWLELFQRSVALFCVVQGVGYWVRLMGFFEGPEWRFDLMPFYWQATAAPLAVLLPVAAVGLWLLVSWGPVVWFLCAATETMMYGFLPHLFGPWPWLVVLYGLIAAAFAALRTLLYLERRQQAH
ncbi:DUF6163 family protein [Chelativorans intermedius]|uniref:DUF6163 family protein n=1 Tax=Chelativorans intermedius TaxID=515947 RepID=A0ABV6D4X7_9HYPH|nr:DUF6163 family protein [Chelativorans intermedius]MCT8999034.1 DUF6163 family protein [Chelativorans intermedius]